MEKSTATPDRQCCFTRENSYILCNDSGFLFLYKTSILGTPINNIIIQNIIKSYVFKSLTKYNFLINLSIQKNNNFIIKRVFKIKSLP